MPVAETARRIHDVVPRPSGPDRCDRCGSPLGRRSRALTVKAHAHHGGLADGSHYMLCTGCSRGLADWLGDRGRAT